jgi:hypothetical protein
MVDLPSQPASSVGGGASLAFLVGRIFRGKPVSTLPDNAPARGRAGIIALTTLCLPLVFGGCSNGDFGRVKPGLVTDDIHAWVGTTAALGNAAPISDYPLTDDERTLRDLAYPLIEPPYDRQRWYGFLNEYGIGRIFRRDWSWFDERAYERVLMSEPVRSQAVRYARLGDDIGNDRTRIPPFFLLAARVLDMDRRREKNLAATARLTEPERHNALARNAENALVVSWVQWSLVARALSYRYALERLAIAAPMPAATDIERSLVALQDLIGNYRLLPGPDMVPGPGVVTLPPFEGPVPAPAGPRRKPVSVLGRSIGPEIGSAQVGEA